MIPLHDCLLPDFGTDILSSQHNLLIFVDEHKHQSYKEEKRT